MSRVSLKLLSLILILLPAVLHSKPALAARLSEYSGTIGSARVKFTIVSQATTLSGALPAGPVKGEYFYTSYLTDIPLQGEIGSDRDITIYELGENNKPSAVIKGKFPETDPQHHFPSREKLGAEVIVGTWSRLDGSGSLPVYLCSDSDTFADIDHRYVDAGVKDDKALEASVRTFRTAVLAGDKNEVAALLNYPLTVSIGGKRKELADAPEFLKYYKRIFSPKFVGAIRDAVPHNMFVRYDGVMLGRGEVWFDADGKVKALND